MTIEFSSSGHSGIQRKSCAKILLTFDSAQQALRTQAIYEYSGDQLQDSNIPMAEGEVFEVVEEDTDGYGVDKTFRDV